MDVVAYCRFSSDAQRDGFSIEAQQRAIKDYCDRNKYDLVRFYVDEARSGTNDKRESFQEMIGDITKKNDFKAIIVHKLDRFSRDKYDFAYYRRILSKHGVKLISVVENVDGDSPENDILLAVLEAFAAFYPKNLSREVRKGMNEAARKGLFNGGPLPYGYEVDPISRTYKIVPAEAAIVRQIYEMFLEGYSAKEISNALEGMGITSKKGQPLTSKAVLRYLTNEKYTGTYKFNAYEYNNHRDPLTPRSDLIRIEDSFPAIIDKETWERVQVLIDGNKRPTRARNTTENYILTGLLYCGGCGSLMVGSSSTKKTKEGKSIYKYYMCPKHHKKNCSCSNIKKSYIEDLVFSIIKDDLFTGKVLDKIIDDLDAELKKVSYIDPLEYKEYKKMVKDINQQISRLLTAYLEKVLSKEEFSERRLELVEKRDKYQALLDRCERLNISKEEIRAKLIKFADKLLNDDVNDLERRKEAILCIIERVELDNKKIRVTFKFNITADKGTYGDPYGIRTHECMRERHVS